MHRIARLGWACFVMATVGALLPQAAAQQAPPASTEGLPSLSVANCESKPTCSVETQVRATVGRNGSNGLLFHVSGSDWATFRWFYSNPIPGMGNEVQDADVLSLWYRLVPASLASVTGADALRIALTFSDIVPKKSVALQSCTGETQGEWHHAKIPLHELISSTQANLLPTAARVLHVFATQGAPYDFDLYLDDITIEREATASQSSRCDSSRYPPFPESVRPPRTAIPSPPSPELEDSDCIEPPALVAEHEQWESETQSQVILRLPKLNRCLSSSATSGEIRATIQLFFAESGTVRTISLQRSTTDNCKIIACLKSALQGLKTRPPRPKTASLSAYLQTTAGNNPAWTLAFPEKPDEFITEAESKASCIETSAGTAASNPQRDPRLIQKVVRAHYPLFRSCYEQALAKNRTLYGKVQTRFGVEPSGKVEYAYAEKGTSITDCEMVRCIEKAYLELRFPEYEGEPTTVIYPIMFQPG